MTNNGKGSMDESLKIKELMEMRLLTKSIRELTLAVNNLALTQTDSYFNHRELPEHLKNQSM